MIRFFLVAVLMVSISNVAFAQLDTIKAYYANLTHFNLDQEEYHIDGVLVSEEEYHRIDSNSIYHYSKLNHPVYIKAFNYHDTIAREGIFYKTRWYGEVKKYKNGKIESIINYTPFAFGEKPIRDGFSTFFNQEGDTIHQDIWKEGNFVKELIPRSHNTIWKTNISLDSVNYDHRYTMSYKQWKKFKNISVTPSYQNNQANGKELVIAICLLRDTEHLYTTNFHIEELTAKNLKKWKKKIKKKHIPYSHLSITIKQIQNNKEPITILTHNILIQK